MLSMATYPQDYIDACRARTRERIAAFRALDDPGADFAAGYFAANLLALDHHFMHRARGLEGKDGNPLNEVRVLGDSLMEHGGVLTPDKQIKLRPDRSVLGLAPGETIALDADGFARLAEAYLDAIEARYT